jgi:hypothetical protein
MCARGSATRPSALVLSVTAAVVATWLCGCGRPEAPADAGSGRQLASASAKSVRATPVVSHPPRLPSGGRWQDVGPLGHRAAGLPRDGKVTYVSAPMGTAHRDRRIRVSDLATRRTVELDWSSPDVALPTLVDGTHVLFSSDSYYISLADLDTGVARVLARVAHGGLGYRAASGAAVYTAVGPRGEPRAVWSLALDGTARPERSAVRAPELMDSTRHRRIRFSPDGQWFSLPFGPADKSAPYRIARWPDGEYVDAALDAAWPAGTYTGWAMGVDFGAEGLYSLNGNRTDTPCQLMLYRLGESSVRAGALLSWPPPAVLSGTLAVSERLGGAIVSTRTSEGTSSLAFAPFGRGGALVRLCAGEDPDVWPR